MSFPDTLCRVSWTSNRSKRNLCSTQQSGSNHQHSPPTNVQDLRSFLGLLNYYGKFIRNLSSILHPLNGLLRANQKQRWTDECTKAFEEAKRQLVSANVLTHCLWNRSCNFSCPSRCIRKTNFLCLTHTN